MSFGKMEKNWYWDLDFYYLLPLPVTEIRCINKCTDAVNNVKLHNRIARQKIHPAIVNFELFLNENKSDFPEFCSVTFEQHVKSSKSYERTEKKMHAKSTIIS